MTRKGSRSGLFNLLTKSDKSLLEASEVGTGQRSVRDVTARYASSSSGKDERASAKHMTVEEFDAAFDRGEV